MSTDFDLRVVRRVATITVSRPSKLNAFTRPMIREFLTLLSCVDEDDGVAAVIVTGAGRAFSAGMDVSAGVTTFDVAGRPDAPEASTYREGAGQISMRLLSMNKPVIAAINGPAFGMGATVTLAMDVRLASESATFGFVFTRRGLVPEGASSWLLPRIVGIARAQEWVCTGRTVSAADARDAGLVRSLHAASDLIPEATALAHEIADNAAPVSVALARRLMWHMLSVSDPAEAHRLESALLYVRGQSADAHEGVRAFLEKRPPRFPMTINEGMSSFQMFGK